MSNFTRIVILYKDYYLSLIYERIDKKRYSVNYVFFLISKMF